MATVPTEEETLGYFQSLSNWGRWGPDDELGTLNHITPEKRLRAATLVRDGVTVTCARTISPALAPDVVAQPMRYMVDSGEGLAHSEKVGPPFVAEFIGMVYHGNTITHLDSLSHVFYESKMYNGRPAHLVSTRHGATAESIELLQNGVVTRGVLLDIPRLRGVPWLEPGDGVLREDLEAAEEAQGVHVEAGDALLIRTGQLRRRTELGPWDIETEGGTGPHVGCLPFCHERSVALVGSDTSNSLPHRGYHQLGDPFHQIGLVAMGLWLLDNANLEDLVRACEERSRWDFLLTIAPLRIEGGTGSPVNPIAMF